MLSSEEVQKGKDEARSLLDQEFAKSQKPIPSVRTHQHHYVMFQDPQDSLGATGRYHEREVVKYDGTTGYDHSCAYRCP